MGWKASAIIIKPLVNMPAKDLLEKLGFTDITESEPEPFEIAVYPRNECLYVGNYHGCTIFSGETLVMDIFERAGTPLEEKLIDLFPTAEICAVTLHSSMNLWGYIVIKNGKRIRERLGDSDSGTMLNSGEPLEEEKELLSQSVIGEDGQRIYHLKDDPSEPYMEDQVGENFVFEMFRRYTGEALDRHDDLLFNTSFEGFNVAWPKIDLRKEYEKQQQNIKPAQKSWWKFW